MSDEERAFLLALAYERCVVGPPLDVRDAKIKANQTAYRLVLAAERLADGAAPTEG